MLICAVCIIVFVMRQHGEEDGLGAISGQTETQDSFYGKNSLLYSLSKNKSSVWDRTNQTSNWPKQH